VGSSGLKAENEKVPGNAGMVRFGGAVFGSVLVFAIVKFLPPSPLRLGMETACAGAVYLGLGSPLHRRASDAFSRRSIDRYVVLSLAATLLYWYSALLATSWSFFPRFFPLRWLGEDLSLRTYFLEACVVVSAGLLSIALRSKMK
jgi:cation transport ATPase